MIRSVTAAPKATGMDLAAAASKPPVATDSQVLNKLWNEYLETNKLTPDQLEYSGASSLKAARVLGEFQLATTSIKAYNQLSPQENSECVRLANKQFYLDKKRRLDLNDREISTTQLGLATADQLQAPLAPSAKAIQILGNAEYLAPVKARNLLGNATEQEEDGCRLLADRQWHEDMVKQSQEFTLRVLQQRPTEDKLEIQAPVSDKALAFFGEEDLAMQSKLASKPVDRVKPKAVQLLGEPFLAGKKAESILLGETLKQRSASLFTRNVNLDAASQSRKMSLC